MKIGTKSLLFGAHCFFLHPFFVAAAWWRLFGFPWDPRLWVAFFVHDIGYWGKPNMDGPEGESHVLLGASVMSVFGWEWYWFTAMHSRFWAQQEGFRPSALCYADKLAIVLTPWWLYLPMVRLTGEIDEYQAATKHAQETGFRPEDKASWERDRRWHRTLHTYLEGWVARARPEIEESRRRIPT